MRRFSNYTLLVAAPLALASSGCVSGPSWLLGRTHQDAAYYQLRLTQAAQRYEQDGQYESAYHVYSQLATQQPNNQIAQQKVQQLAQLINSQEASGVGDPGTPRTADQALKMLAQIQTQHREDVAARRRINSRNPDVMLAEIQQRLDAYKAEQAKLNEPLPVAPAVKKTAEVPVMELASQTRAAAPAEVSTPAWASNAVTPSAGDETSNVAWWDLSAPADNAVTVSNAPAPPPIKEELPKVVSVPAVRNEALPQVVPAREKDWQTTSLARLCDHIPADLSDAVAKLDSSEAEVKIEGLSALALRGEEAKPVSLAVRALLKHENPVVRANAAEALYAIEHDTWDSIKTLTELLGSSDETVVQLSCYILGHMGTSAELAVPHLEIALASEAGLTSLHAAEALLKIQGQHADAFDALEDALASDDRDLRWFGAVAMGSVKGDLSAQAAEVLKGSLHDEEADVRAAAALSLGGMGQNAELAISELEEVAQFDEDDVRNAASTALACLRR